jgi:microcystin-dependent protein
MEGTLAEIRMFAGNFAPQAWAFCQNQLMQISQNTALFSLLGTTYGGNGQTTFALPDLRGRIPVGLGSGPGLPQYQLGELSGAPSVTLTVANLPVHNHPLTGAVSIQANADSGGLSGDPSAKRLAAPGANMYTSATGDLVSMAAPVSTLAIGNAGGNQALSTMPPYSAMNFVICLQGIFPSRN